MGNEQKYKYIYTSEHSLCVLCSPSYVFEFTNKYTIDIYRYSSFCRVLNKERRNGAKKKSESYLNKKKKIKYKSNNFHRILNINTLLLHVIQHRLSTRTQSYLYPINTGGKCVLTPPLPRSRMEKRNRFTYYNSASAKNLLMPAKYESIVLTAFDLIFVELKWLCRYSSKLVRNRLGA